ncbi:MAG: FAD-dependent oxidoreductase, partial [Victivallales bacterium]
MSKVYDVIVAGGGPGGVSAAVAAARNGMSVLMIERYGFAGGMATSGLVNPFMYYRSNTDANYYLPSPVFMEIVKSLSENGALEKDGHVFDDEILKILLDNILLESKVEILYHSMVTGAVSKNGTVSEITVACKEGRKDFKAKIFIDATGDGDLASFAGFETQKGRKEDGACQPMTLCFRLGGVKADDWGALHKELNEIYMEGKAKGEISDPRENVLIFRTLRPDVVHFNTTRVIAKDGTISKDLGEAEIVARRQTWELFNVFKSRAQSCRDSFILKIATQIGVRETRRVMGEYVLDADDVVKAKTFDDGIARSSYPIDIHNPSGSGTVIKAVEGGYYEIPYRCIIPKGSKNLLMACRAISSTHEAHSSLRVMPVVASVGEA